jgi:hypothetical protein
VLKKKNNKRPQEKRVNRERGKAKKRKSPNKNKIEK